MTAQNLFDLQRDAIQWWLDWEENDAPRVTLSKKYIGASNIKTLSHLEIMYCYLYFQEESAKS